MSLTFNAVSKAYGDLAVLENLSFSLEKNRPLCVTGPSGRGKTTVLRLTLGLEKPDTGRIAADNLRFAAVFQEDRLFEGFDAAENIRLATGLRERGEAERELLRLLPPDALGKPVSLLSGGQRRRVCLVRACLAKANCLVLDEPFTGLDRENAALAAAYLREKSQNRLLLMAAHQADIPDWCEILSL